MCFEDVSYVTNDFERDKTTSDEADHRLSNVCAGVPPNMQGRCHLICSIVEMAVRLSWGGTRSMSSPVISNSCLEAFSCSGTMTSLHSAQ